MDELKLRALIFNDLLKYKYEIQLGKRGKLTDINLTFDKSDFHHLIGLQKLTDIKILKQDSCRVFDKIVNGEITYKDICKSRYMVNIEDRYKNIIYLEELLDNNDLIFRCNNNKRQNYSRINYEYVLESLKDNRSFYIFIRSRGSSESNEKVCCSYFLKENNNFTQNNIRMSILQKSKINTLNDYITVIKARKEPLGIC